MVDYDQERDTMMFPQKPLPDVERLRDFARKLDFPSIWSTFSSDQLVKKERELRKAKDKAAAKLPKGKQAYEKIFNEWRSVRDELASVLMRIWGEQMEFRLGNMLGRFADSMGNVRRMATVCREFIRFFEDSALWRPLYATCECKEKFSGSTPTMFSVLREHIDVAWGYMEAFTVSDKVKSARIALHKLLGYWAHGFAFLGKKVEVSVEQLRDEFSNELEAVKGQLCTPKSFFIRVEKRASPIADEDGTPPSFDSARDSKVDELRDMMKQLQSLVLILCGENQKGFEKMVEGFKNLQHYIAKRTRTHKQGTAPGPKRTPTRYDDLRRVREYVMKERMSLLKACNVVHAENQQRPDREDHYGSADSMRGEYLKRFKNAQ